MSATAWVVECAGCKCCIVCFARDPQTEHGQTKPLLPPASSCVLECLCCGSAYRYTGADFVAGVPKRNPACLRKQGRQPTGKMDSAVVVAASIVAAIRLRGEPITQSPKVVGVVADSIRLAQMVVDRMERR
jgi:hypothetical protein